MKVAKTIAERRSQWQELELKCILFENRRRKYIQPQDVSKFAALYRSACADLALADAYQLPPNTVQYLHRLVGRAHNQLYRSQGFKYAGWGKVLFQDVPQRIFRDGCVQVAFAMFWGVFLLSAYLASTDAVWPDYATSILPEQHLSQMEESFSQPIQGRSSKMNPVMAGFYIKHNTSIGLRCFVGGLLVIPGVLITCFNAAILGASFGYMARPDVVEGANFFHFVTAHGPFELTAIVLSAGAGLRLGFSWLKTDGLARTSSLRKAAKETMPLMGAAMILFFLAALIEGFLSPSAAPYALKAMVALGSSGLLMFYFVVLGFPRGDVDAA